VSLLKLKSIFSPTNVKFQDNQSDLTTLDSIFDDRILPLSKIYFQNQPQGKFDTKFNYNENSSINRTYGFNVNINAPILDSILRGRVYDQTQFSQNFTNDNLFVKPETGEIVEELYKTQTFDPRATTPKEGTLYFNTNNSFNPATNPTDFSTAIGNNDLPYTPLTELGGQFQENLSWENLYNSNHSPKGDPSYKGKSAVNYGPNVNRDNLKIGTQGFNFNQGTGTLVDQLFGGDRGSEPYKISPIGDEGRDINKGSRFLPLSRAFEDGDRILQFLKSPAGVGFILKQNVNIPIRNTVVRDGGDLKRKPQRFGVTYNPLSPLLSSAARLVGQGVPNVLIRSSGLDFDLGILEPQEYGANATDSKIDVNKTFTQGTSDGGNLLTQLGDALTNINPFGGGPTVPKVSKGDKMTLQPIESGTKIENGTLTQPGVSSVNIDFKVDSEVSEDGMPFYFKDLRTSEYIFFRAYIEGLTENVSPTYTPHNYMGRSEPVYTYERAERELSFTLKLIAQTESEFDKIYEKMEHLTSLCYPQYIDEKENAPTGETGYGHRMKAPLTRLRYGDMYGRTNDELMGYVKSLSYSIDQSSTYDTRGGKRAPKHIIATIGYQVIHNQSPSINMSRDNKQKFYGVNKNG